MSRDPRNKDRREHSADGDDLSFLNIHLHLNVAAHPTAAWTGRQLLEACRFEETSIISICAWLPEGPALARTTTG